MVDLNHLCVSLHLSLPDRLVFVQITFKFTSHSRAHQNTEDAVKTQSSCEGEVAYIHKKTTLCCCQPTGQNGSEFLLIVFASKTNEWKQMCREFKFVCDAQVASEKGWR